MPTKIALTGSHSTGKTTLAIALVEELADADLTPEVPRLVVADTNDEQFFQRGNNTFVRQTLVVARQLEEETSAMQRAGSLVVCDRTAADHWAYTRVLFPQEVVTVEGRLWEALVERWLRTYDLIVRLPPELPIELDGVREEDIAFQQSIDEELQAIYARANIELAVATGTVAERVARCRQLLDDVR
jgi:nicotinamide riboside kinase